MRLAVPRTRPRSGRTVTTAALLLTALSLVTGGCARFDDSASSPFSPEPSFGNGAEVKPEQPQQPTPTKERKESGPCIDPDPNVIATCLDSTGGLVALPDGNSALVAERRTGRIMRVTAGQQPVEVAHIDVDGSGDGGLLDIALSPAYPEDGLIYAYITTGSDNRVVRIAPGDIPKDVLVGIPKGSTGNRGAVAFDNPNELLVLTGDAGNPAAAADPASLSGKLLRLAKPVVSPDAHPPTQIALSGIGDAGDVCPGPGGNIWVTDRTPTEDRLQKIDKNGVVVNPVWTWPDRPGVAGCAAAADAVAISLTNAKAVAVATVDKDSGAVTAAPTLVAQDKYGSLNGAALGQDGSIWAGTVNKDGGQPGPNDDRVVKIQVPAGGGGAD